MYFSRRMMSCRGYDDDEVDPKSDPPVKYQLKAQPISKADYIPLRLSMKQRKSQRLIRAITLASSYTDKVDTDFDKPVKREMAIAKEVLASIRGLVVALDLVQGSQLMNEKDFAPYENEIIQAIEVSRRYKIMNPDLLRTDYVKFLYWIQDAVFSDGVNQALGFSIASPILTVSAQLEKLGIKGLLDDPRLGLMITPVPRIKEMKQLNLALRYKDKLVSAVCKEWAAKSDGDANCSADDVEVCIRSLNDANNFDDDNSDSAGQLLQLFQKMFKPVENPSAETNLTIKEGQEGSRLSHEHAMQYHYVAQSLTLWRLITRDMFRLWKLAEDDMLTTENPYVFRNTGQGKQRVQPSPQLFGAVKDILEQAKRDLGQWVGSERIHMGDNQVPNGHFFIEKYAQVSRIIVPILRTVAFIQRRYDGEDQTYKAQLNRGNDAYKTYVDNVFGTVEKAQLAILRDFFRHGFDGSGGDNMDDAGSCIDGRLTSAWHWCSMITQKPYYPLFLMAGFQSFDGDLSL